tara:strand:- start:54 stop:1940 length:1887 start_codon:yes stop_codon:yes gene_type:complete
MAIKNFKEILNKEAKRVDIKDRKIFERGRMPAFFGRGMTDTIEFILYDNGSNQLPQGEKGKLVRYINISEIDNIRNYLLIARGAASNQAPEYFVDVEKLINEAGYKNGLFRTQITLLNKRVGSEHFQNKVWIHEISPSRTEVRVLPVKTEDVFLEKDLRDRYKILLQNGEFKDDILNRLDGFVDSIDANAVLKKVQALYGQDWINNVKREFKIQDFNGFINDVTIKAKQAIGYYISNRGYTFGKSDYGKPLIDDLQAPKGDRKRRNKRGRRRKSNSQRLDIRTLQKKSMEIICDAIRFLLPKRNLQVPESPTLTKLASRDKISTILQTFGTSKKIDTQVTKPVRITKPLKVVAAKITTKPVEKPAPIKPIKIAPPAKKYYFYEVYFRRRGISRKSAVVEYIDMSGDKNSFSMPPGKRVKICALEGSVNTKFQKKKVRVTKKELCVVDTPVPKFVRPKRPPVRKDLSKEQIKVVKDLNLPTPIKTKTQIKYDIGIDEIKANIKKSFLGLPKIKFGGLHAGGRRRAPSPPAPPTRRETRRNKRRRRGRKPVVTIPSNRRRRRTRSTPKVVSPPRMSFVQRKRKLRGIATPPRQNFRSRGGGGSIQNFGSGRVQNQFTPGNTFTGYSRGGY